MYLMLPASLSVTDSVLQRKRHSNELVDRRRIAGSNGAGITQRFLSHRGMAQERVWVSNYDNVPMTKTITQAKMQKGLAVR